MSDILNAKGSGAILLAILLMLVIVYTLIKKNKKVDDIQDIKTTKQECSLDLNDFDATLACLIASIELRNETNKNVKVCSVRRVN